MDFNRLNIKIIPLIVELIANLVYQKMPDCGEPFIPRKNALAPHRKISVVIVSEGKRVLNNGYHATHIQQVLPIIMMF